MQGVTVFLASITQNMVCSCFYADSDSDMEGERYTCIPQYTTVYHSIPQYITVYHSIPQYITVYHSIPQYITVYHSIPQYITVYHIYHSIPWYIIVYHSIPWYITVYHSIPQYITIMQCTAFLSDQPLLRICWCNKETVASMVILANGHFKRFYIDHHYYDQPITVHYVCIIPPGIFLM